MEKYNHVSVRFHTNGQTYTYRVPSRYKVSKGQFVVVLGSGGKQIVQVREVLEDYQEKPGIKYKNIYGIVKLVEEPNQPTPKGTLFSSEKAQQQYNKALAASLTAAKEKRRNSRQEDDNIF